MSNVVLPNNFNSCADLMMAKTGQKLIFVKEYFCNECGKMMSSKLRLCPIEVEVRGLKTICNKRYDK